MGFVPYSGKNRGSTNCGWKIVNKILKCQMNKYETVQEDKIFGKR